MASVAWPYLELMGSWLSPISVTAPVACGMVSLSQRARKWSPNTYKKENRNKHVARHPFPTLQKQLINDVPQLVPGSNPGVVFVAVRSQTRWGPQSAQSGAIFGYFGDGAGDGDGVVSEVPINTWFTSAHGPWSNGCGEWMRAMRTRKGKGKGIGMEMGLGDAALSRLFVCPCMGLCVRQPKSWSLSLPSAIKIPLINFEIRRVFEKAKKKCPPKVRINSRPMGRTQSQSRLHSLFSVLSRPRCTSLRPTMSA